MVDDFIAQAFGLLSFALGILTFCQTDDKKLKMVMIVLQLNHVVHFLLLGSLVSAISCLISVGRTALALKVNSKSVAVIFVVLGISFGIYMADNIWQLWSILGSAIGTYSVFVLKGIKLRIGFLCGSCCWLINNILVGSIGGTMLEVAVISMNLLTIFRMHRKPELSASN